MKSVDIAEQFFSAADGIELVEACSECHAFKGTLIKPVGSLSVGESATIWFDWGSGTARVYKDIDSVARHVFAISIVLEPITG